MYTCLGAVVTPAQYSREGEQQDRNGDEGGTEAAEYGSKSLTYQSGTGHIHQYGTGVQIDPSGVHTTMVSAKTSKMPHIP